MTLAEMIYAARDTSDPDDYIARVKAVVADELVRLDSTARLEDTHYFNHSAIPDFVVTWGGETGRREVFLRHSYASVEAADDERYLAEADAMVMSLRPDAVEAHDSAVAQKASTSSRLLVTDTEAVDVIGGAPSADARPLTSLVRANFLRGAKGRVDTARAEELLQLDDPSAPVAPDTAQRLITTSFAEDAALRISRTAELISIALAGGTERDAPSISGRLSLAELRTLLPWLLRQDNARTNRLFWKYVGSLFSFEELEGIRNDLTGLDLSPLILANASEWTARRAYVGLMPPRDDGLAAEARPYWSFENAALSIDVEGRRLYLAHNGTMLKKRPGNRTPDWNTVKPTLGGRRIASIELRGIRRSVTLHAEQSPDIRADVEDVTRELDDAYFVDRLTLRVLAPGEAEGTRDVDVRFDEGLIVADSEVSLSDLTAAALQVLEFANPVPSAISDEIIGIAWDAEGGD